jgi:hypothetical protein
MGTSIGIVNTKHLTVIDTFVLLTLVEVTHRKGQGLNGKFLRFSNEKSIFF